MPYLYNDPELDQALQKHRLRTFDGCVVKGCVNPRAPVSMLVVEHDDGDDGHVVAEPVFCYMHNGCKKCGRLTGWSAVFCLYCDYRESRQRRRRRRRQKRPRLEEPE